MKTKKTVSGIHCGTCQSQECRQYYPRGIPGYCLASGARAALEKSSAEYRKPEVKQIYLASGRVFAGGYGSWNRVKESIEFAREMKVRKVGFASCIGLIAELQAACELFRGAGFEVVGVNCQVGRVKPGERLPEIKPGEDKGLWCNPVAQAMLLNSLKSEVNFIIGLCLGHDMLFARYSKAPVSTMIVKDRVLGHNPVAALHTQPARALLWKEYCGDINGYGSGGQARH